MKHAILAGVAIDDPKRSFGPGPSLTAMEATLEALGGWAIQRVEGPDATREGILRALTELEPALQPDDVVLFHFVGHGGVVEILDLQPPLGRRPVFYLATARDDRKWRFEGILDVELSRVLAGMDRRCGNVSVILDSCYSAQVVRGPLWSLPESPAWLRAVADQLAEPVGLLHPASHPRIVRLAASSSLRQGFAERVVEGGHLGRLTGLVCEVVHEAGAAVERLTWDALAHRVREQAIRRLGCEAQWVSLAGPRQRVLFSRQEAPRAATVGFVPRDDGFGGWLRAGALQGVEPKDEWGLAELTLDPDLRPKWRARVRVVDTDLNRAEVEFLEPTASPMIELVGASAWLLRARNRAAVEIDDPELRELADHSSWIEHTPGSRPLARASVVDGHLELRRHEGDHTMIRTPADPAGRARALAWLEDWARTRRLRDVATAGASRPSLVRVTLGYAPEVGARRRPVDPKARARVRVGGRLYLSARRETTKASCFVSVIYIDVAGRPTLLDGAEPDGIELLRGEVRDLGVHPHQRGAGIELRWTPELARDTPRLATLLVLASQRQIALGHLVDGQSAGIPRDWAAKPRSATRGRLATPRPRTGPELARDWSATVIELVLAP